jgi:hypothetical protein
VFATLFDSREYAPTIEARIALLQRLGGPFLTSDPGEGHVARAAGLQVGLIVSADGATDGANGADGDGQAGTVSGRDVGAVRDLTPEIVAIRCAALGDAQMHDEATGGAERRSKLLTRLATSLDALSGAHRMIIAIDGALAPLSAAEWGNLAAESLAIDLIGDPDSWRAAATWPGTRGLLLGLIPPPGGPAPEGPEVLLWAIGYAASLGGRGGDRVGVAGLPRRNGASCESSVADSADAAARIDALSRIMELTAADGVTRRAHLDPRAVSPAAQLLSERRSR